MRSEMRILTRIPRPWIPAAVLVVSGFLASGFAAEKSPLPAREVPAAEEPGEDRAGDQSSPLAAPTYIPPTGEERFEDYLKQSFGPLAFVSSGLAAGIDQARDKNPEWGQGMEGYGKRLASKYGHHLLRVGFESSAAALLKEDLRYVPAAASGFWPRTGHALQQIFLARSEDGSSRFAVSRWSAALSAGVISRSWHPGDERSVRRGLRSGTISLGIKTGMNVVREFWPEIRRMLRR